MLPPKVMAVRELVAKMPPLPVPPTVRQCSVQGLSPYHRLLARPLRSDFTASPMKTADS